MIVRRFLLWMRTASVEERAEGVAALARAYLYSELSDEDRLDAEEALTALLDDPSPSVRTALADAIGSAANAPAHLVVALAYDHSDIAAIVLARSPVLDDADLIDCAAVGDALIQSAIAIRSHLSASVAAALAEVGCLDALVSLARNTSAAIPEFSFLRIMERFGSDDPLRDALLQRRDLPISVRHAVAIAMSESMASYAIENGMMSEERCRRLMRDARERATIEIAMHHSDECPALVEHLRNTGQLTPLVLLRAVLSGAVSFVEAALSDLAGMPRSRVTAFLADPRGGGAMAVYRRSGLPASLASVFHAAFLALHEVGEGWVQKARPQLSRVVVSHVIASCRRMPDAERAHVLSLLRRFEAEAARETARERAEQLADQAALEALMAIDPDGTLLLQAPEADIQLADDEADFSPDALEDDAQVDAIWPQVDPDAPLGAPGDEVDLSELEQAFASEVEERRRERLQIA